MNNTTQKISEVLNNDNTSNVIFPKMPMRWTCCAECLAGSYDYGRDQVWCGKYRYWYDGSDGCSAGPNG